jgi:DNA-binding MarR family transcriptional regulator
MLIAHLHRTALELERRLDALAEERGITGKQLLLLMFMSHLALASSSPSVESRFGDLARAMGQSGSLTSKQLRTLVEAGLCTKSIGGLGREPVDGRCVRYRLTRAGEALCAERLPGFMQIERCLRTDAYPFSKKPPAYWLPECQQRLQDLATIELGRESDLLAPVHQRRDS